MGYIIYTLCRSLALLRPYCFHRPTVPTLGKAIAIWRSGRHITFAMGTELREQGYDVAALAKAHRA